ncbi:MAG: winged helix-turn-helix domain-containing protein [Candidatus Omnitrophica bacterium]|nr:winged helix-turn-helix domain-containing protein [Candidatus Omnitrophota bacterium]
MITEIGFAAGDIWNYLDKHGESSFREIVKAIDKPRDLALMSLGWLAREGHVEVVKSGRNDFKVKLRNR